MKLANILRRIVCTAIVVFAVAGNIFAQNHIDTDYAVQIMRHVQDANNFNREFQQEKVFLQLDNTSYFQGETIWFKAFVVNASTMGRSESGVLYVELLSPTGILLQQKKLKIIAGQADGFIKLTESLLSRKSG